MKQREYAASFTVETALLMPLFLGVIVFFLLTVFFQYDMVRLQANKVALCLETRTEQEVRAAAAAGCLLFEVKRCEKTEGIFQSGFSAELVRKTGFAGKFLEHHKQTLRGSWKRLSVTEEIRLTDVCFGLLEDLK